jgi:alkylation response protein AidB-like acyl-CoA dehydrogenase
MDGDTPRQLDGKPDGRLFLIRTADIDISPTWQAAAAMRGTGSNAVSIDNVFVPEGFTYTLAKPLVVDRPLYHLSMGLLFFPNVSAIACGVLETALTSATDDLSSKVASYSGQTLRDQAPIQELIANSDAALRAARSGVRDATDAVWKVGCTGTEIPQRLKAGLYAASFYAIESVRETIGRLFARGTRDAFLQGHPVERALRNLHAIAFGVEGTRILQHSAGRVLLGGEPLDPSF